ncbi:hypothetical protein [Salinarimonas ramus]|nr:hypothetical protein [Salinarimonas ramus]
MGRTVSRAHAFAEQDLSVDLADMPALPRSGLVLAGVTLTSG